MGETKDQSEGVVKAIWSYQKSGSEWLKLVLTSCKYNQPVQDWAAGDEYVKSYPHAPKNAEWVKTHEARLPADIESSIAVVRHPLDIAVSAWRYRVVIDKNMFISPYEYLLQFCEAHGDPSFNTLNKGTLNDFILNVKSEKRGVYIPYEQLVKDRRTFWPCLLLVGEARWDYDTVNYMMKTLSPHYMRLMDKKNFLGRVQIDQYLDYASDELRVAYEANFPEFITMGYTYDGPDNAGE